MADRQGGGHPACERIPRLWARPHEIVEPRSHARGVPVSGLVRVLPWTGCRASGLSGGRFIIFPSLHLLRLDGVEAFDPDCMLPISVNGSSNVANLLPDLLPASPVPLFY